MYSNRADRVVDVELVVEEPYSEYYEQTRNKTDNDSAEGVCYVTGSRDSYKTCERSVQTHTYVGLAVLNPGENHTCNGSNCGSYGSCQEDRAELSDRCSGSAVKSVPAEPKDEHAERAQSDVVTGESADLCDLAFLVSLELTDTCSEDFRADESGDTADHMDSAGACEIVEAELVEPAAAPNPVSLDGIDERGDNS